MQIFFNLSSFDNQHSLKRMTLQIAYHGRTVPTEYRSNFRSPRVFLRFNQDPNVDTGTRSRILEFPILSEFTANLQHFAGGKGKHHIPVEGGKRRENCSGYACTRHSGQNGCLIAIQGATRSGCINSVQALICSGLFKDRYMASHKGLPLT